MVPKSGTMPARHASQPTRQIVTPRSSNRRMAASVASQRAQVVQQRLLVVDGQQTEVLNHLVGFRSLTLMLVDGHCQVIGTPVMQEEDALSDPPQRSSAELAAIRATLRNSVSQPSSHVVQREVAQRLEGHLAQRGNRRLSRGQRWNVTGSTADVGEDLLAASR